MKVPLCLTTLFVASALLAACSTSPVSQPTNTAETAVASPSPDAIAQAISSARPVASDLGNRGDGSDLAVQLVGLGEDSWPSGLRMLIIRADQSTGLTVDQAIQVAEAGAIAPERPDPSGTIRLPAEATDIQGEPIVEDVTYLAQVLWAESSAPALSRPSEPFVLKNDTAVHTLVAEFPSATGGLAVDDDGNLYAADIGRAPLRNGSSIYRISPDGQVELWVSGQGLSGASGNAFGAHGILYQSSLSANTVHRISPDGEVTVLTADGIQGPVGIAIGPGDGLYVASCRGGSVQRISPDGSSQTYARSSLMACPNGITVDDDGTLYVANFSNGNVLRVSQDGEAEVLANLPGGNNGHILYHQGLLYVVDRGGHQIFELTLAGALNLLAGTGERGHSDGPASRAKFSLPNDIVPSPDGLRLYVNEVVPVTGGDNLPSRIRVIVLARQE